MKRTKLLITSEIKVLLDKAESHFLKAEFAEAEKIVNEVLSSAPNQYAKALAQCLLGDCQWNRAHFDDALLTYKSAYDIAETLHDLSLQSRSLLGRAKVYYRQGDNKKALELIDEAIPFAEKANDLQAQAQVMKMKGNVYFSTCDYKRSLDNHNLAFKLYEEIEDTHHLSVQLNNIGMVYIALVDYEHALEYLVRALTISEKIGDKAGLCHILGNTGLLYNNIGNYSRAVEYLDRGLKIAQDINNPWAIAMFLGNIGTSYVKHEDYTRALDYFSRALSICEEIGSKGSFGLHLHNIGSVHLNCGDLPRALEYFKRALEHDQASGNIEMVIYSTQNIANVERKMGNFEIARHGFIKALNLRREIIKSNTGVAVLLSDLGALLNEETKLNDAIDYLNECIDLAEMLGERDTALRAHKEIADSYSRIGQIAKAYEHLSKHLELDKEIHSEESKKKIEAFNMRVAIAKKEHEMEIQKLKAENLEKQLSAKAIAYATQTELLANFREDLRRIIRKIEVRDPAINELIAKLKELPDGVNWKEFEEQFSQVHPEFRGNLLKKYPGLTEIELKVSALLRLKLKTPDIARLLSLSERTIDNHRHRIRKKIGLDGNVDFAKFLAAF